MTTVTDTYALAGIPRQVEGEYNPIKDGVWTFASTDGSVQSFADTDAHGNVLVSIELLANMLAPLGLRPEKFESSPKD